MHGADRQLREQCFFSLVGASIKDAITRINILETPLKASRILFTWQAASKVIFKREKKKKEKALNT